MTSQHDAFTKPVPIIPTEDDITNLNAALDIVDDLWAAAEVEEGKYAASLNPRLAKVSEFAFSELIKKYPGLCDNVERTEEELDAEVKQLATLKAKWLSAKAHGARAAIYTVAAVIVGKFFGGANRAAIAAGVALLTEGAINLYIRGLLALKKIKKRKGIEEFDPKLVKACEKARAKSKKDVEKSMGEDIEASVELTGEILELRALHAGLDALNSMLDTLESEEGAKYAATLEPRIAGLADGVFTAMLEKFPGLCDKLNMDAAEIEKEIKKLDKLDAQFQQWLRKGHVKKTVVFLLLSMMFSGAGWGGVALSATLVWGIPVAVALYRKGLKALLRIKQRRQLLQKYDARLVEICDRVKRKSDPERVKKLLEEYSKDREQQAGPVEAAISATELHAELDTIHTLLDALDGDTNGKYASAIEPRVAGLSAMALARAIMKFPGLCQLLNMEAKGISFVIKKLDTLMDKIEYATNKGTDITKLVLGSVMVYVFGASWQGMILGPAVTWLIPLQIKLYQKAAHGILRLVQRGLLEKIRPSLDAACAKADPEKARRQFEQEAARQAPRGAEAQDVLEIEASFEAVEALLQLRESDDGVKYAEALDVRIAGLSAMALQKAVHKFPGLCPLFEAGPDEIAKRIRQVDYLYGKILDVADVNLQRVRKYFKPIFMMLFGVRLRDVFVTRAILWALSSMLKNYRMLLKWLLKLAERGVLEGIKPRLMAACDRAQRSPSQIQRELEQSAADAPMELGASSAENELKELHASLDTMLDLMKTMDSPEGAKYASVLEPRLAAMGEATFVKIMEKLPGICKWVDVDVAEIKKEEMRVKRLLKQNTKRLLTEGLTHGTAVFVGILATALFGGAWASVVAALISGPLVFGLYALGALYVKALITLRLMKNRKVINENKLIQACAALKQKQSPEKIRKLLEEHGKKYPQFLDHGKPTQGPAQLGASTDTSDDLLEAAYQHYDTLVALSEEMGEHAAALEPQLREATEALTKARKQEPVLLEADVAEMEALVADLHLVTKRMEKIQLEGHVVVAEQEAVVQQASHIWLRLVRQAPGLCRYLRVSQQNLRKVAASVQRQWQFVQNLWQAGDSDKAKEAGLILLARLKGKELTPEEITIGRAVLPFVEHTVKAFLKGLWALEKWKMKKSLAGRLADVLDQVCYEEYAADIPAERALLREEAQHQRLFQQSLNFAKRPLQASDIEADVAEMEATVEALYLLAEEIEALPPEKQAASVHDSFVQKASTLWMRLVTRAPGLCRYLAMSQYGLKVVADRVEREWAYVEDLWKNRNAEAAKGAAIAIYARVKGYPPGSEVIGQFALPFVEKLVKVFLKGLWTLQKWKLKKSLAGVLIQSLDVACKAVYPIDPPDERQILREEDRQRREFERQQQQRSEDDWA
jgi:hypothetical protein